MPLRPLSPGIIVRMEVTSRTLADVPADVAARAQCRGLGRRLVSALLHAFEGRPLVLPAIVPEHASRAFMEATGWELTPLSQYEMMLTLDATSKPRR